MSQSVDPNFVVIEQVINPRHENQISRALLLDTSNNAPVTQILMPIEPAFPADAPQLKIPGEVTSSLVLNDRVILGLNTGLIYDISRKDGDYHVIDRFTFSDEQKKWDMHGNKYRYEEHTRQRRDLEELVRRNPADARFADILETSKKNDRTTPILLDAMGFINGLRSIKGIVYHDGKIYDASFRGVTQTQSGKSITADNATSLTLYQGKLVYVPTQMNIDTRLAIDVETQSYHQPSPNAGSLVDVHTQEVIHRGFTPFDGSGCRQGNYRIVGDTAYMHHGNWPGERMTSFRVGLPKEGNSKSVRIPTSNKIFEFQDSAIHTWNHHDDHKLVPWNWSPDDVEADRKILYQSKSPFSVNVINGKIWIADSYSADGHTDIFALDKPENRVRLPGYVHFIVPDSS